ncbi:peroxisomal membrane protein 11D-like isoform X2 [Helianthus annuus]|uniref:peroxisomal membrane protein 11D-like isoform X2 n=2 Tax=Helianthus annuus TaxID=4232 RepID=UPI000B8F03A8|nr:peroxisomal membrane protein 11D-like isoform X2 [Helianthus annuus]
MSMISQDLKTAWSQASDLFSDFLVILFLQLEEHHIMELALAILYLNKAETPDKICRAIQYGSKFVSNGEPGTAQNVDKSTSLATKVFRLFKFVSDLHAIISPTAPGTPLPLVLLGKTFSRKMATYISVQAFCPFTIWGLLMHIWNIFSKLIRVKLIGKLQDGTVFIKKGHDDSQPFEFKEDEEQVIDGLDRAVMTMKKGEVALLKVAPEYAFGSTGSEKELAVVPPNATVTDGCCQRNSLVFRC